MSNIPETGRTSRITIRLVVIQILVFSLLLTLGGIAWFLGRMVVKPLGATSDAARQVAAGDLDIELPTSRVREVSELKESFEAMSAGLRESLEQQSRLEQDRRFFISAIAHDLRTPLFSLRGYLEGLQQGVADTPEKRAEYLAVAHEKANVLERMITELSEFTRLEYLDQAPNREPLDLGELLRHLVGGLQPRAETKGVLLELVGSSTPYIVNGDSHLLTRVIENLLDNALRHTPPGGSITVQCREESGQVQFAVSDTGPGIPEADLPHIFAPLYRGESSRSRRTGERSGSGVANGSGVAASMPDSAVSRSMPTASAKARPRATCSGKTR
jgi:signal transduction histidine kinase